MNNFIHPTAIIEEGACIGHNNYIGPYCVIYKNTTIGNYNRFESHCVVGSLPEHKLYFTEGCGFGVKIGDNNVIREFTTINIGTVRDTVIGNNNIMLRGSHCGHDCVIENNVTISCNVLLGGHSYVMKGANMALGSICHQYSIIGAYAMVGMNSTVTKSTPILPGKIYVGSPSIYLKDNEIGIKRADISDYQLHKFSLKWQELEDKKYD